MASTPPPERGNAAIPLPTLRQDIEILRTRVPQPNEIHLNLLDLADQVLDLNGVWAGEGVGRPQPHAGVLDDNLGLVDEERRCGAQHIQTEGG